MRRFAVLAAALVFAVPASARTQGGGSDWPLFGYTPSRSNSGPASTGINAANVSKLARQQVALDGTVDSSPIYLHGVRVAGLCGEK